LVGGYLQANDWLADFRPLGIQRRTFLKVLICHFNDIARLIQKLQSFIIDGHTTLLQDAFSLTFHLFDFLRGGLVFLSLSKPFFIQKK